MTRRDAPHPNHIVEFLERGNPEHEHAQGPATEQQRKVPVAHVLAHPAARILGESDEVPRDRDNLYHAHKEQSKQ